MRSLTLLSLAFGAAVLVTAPAAQADFVTYGSDLSQTPTLQHNKPNDAVYFNDVLASGAPAAVDVIGQVVKIELKGRIVPSSQTLAGGGNPFNTVHFQALAPASAGAWTVPQGGTTVDYTIPWTGSDDQVNTYDTHTDALCVKPGYRVDFATLGGFDYANGYNDGTPFRVFAPVRGSRVLQYSAAGTEGVNNGQTFTPQDSRDGEELLMRYVVATGTDARYACQDPAIQQSGGGGGGGGSTPKPKVTHVTLPPAQHPRITRKWLLAPIGFCHAETTCTGTLTITANGKKIAAKRFALASHKTSPVVVKFNKTGRKLFKRAHRRLKVTVTAVTDPGGAEKTSSVSFVVVPRS